MPLGPGADPALAPLTTIFTSLSVGTLVFYCPNGAIKTFSFSVVAFLHCNWSILDFGLFKDTTLGSENIISPFF